MWKVLVFKCKRAVKHLPVTKVISIFVSVRKSRAIVFL